MSVKITSGTESKEAIQKAFGDKGKDFQIESVSQKPATSVEAKADETPVETAKASEPSEDIEIDESTEVDAEAEGKEELEAKADDKSEGKEPSKKKSGFQRRVDKLTAAKSAAEQRALLAEQKAQLYEEQLKAQTKPVEKKVEAAANSEGEPKPEDFDTVGAYNKAHVKWLLDQEKKAEAQKSLAEKRANAERELVTKHVERVNKFKEATPDFQETVQAVESIPMSIAVQQEILNSDFSAELMYELAKNPEEYAKICKMTDLSKVAKAIGKFELKIEASKAAQADAKTEVKKTTKAPAPISPVGAKASSGPKSTSEAKSYREFRAVRDKEAGA